MHSFSPLFPDHASNIFLLSTERHRRQTAIASLQTLSLTQTITFSILNTWGYDGFKTHTESVSQFYREKRDVFETAMRKHLDGLAEWSTPEAGMFFWCVLIHLSQPALLSGSSSHLIQYFNEPRLHFHLHALDLISVHTSFPNWNDLISMRPLSIS